MNIDLDGLLTVTGSLDQIVGDLTAGIPGAAVDAESGMTAVLDRLHAAATAARRSRVADLTDIADGLGRIRALWIIAENSNAMVPQ